ncbi:glycosyltransferase [Desulfogranum marinum]|uniref:glycosyltransferase n=1 Tax=Desulfogranum marinum TaxID=453220 RepID=UPI001966244A|nr:glycosyltransferase [Desulfogranum marinum]MBM9513010.1 glycosyltransferase [Desulfogranum marinum]
MHIVFWGTYDIGKPRNRILLRGLRENQVEVTECHQHVWAGVEDKSGLRSPWAKISFLLRWLTAYPILVFRYLRLPKHTVVMVGYLGQLDVLILWPFAKLRGAQIVWDAFLSLHDTVVNDRKLCSSKSITGRFLYWWEWLACRAADRVILDTNAHAKFFEHHYRLAPGKTGSVFVGVEPEKFRPSKTHSHQEVTRPLSVLFYGQCIPLHGISIIVEAARLLEDVAVEFTLVGSGQEQAHIKEMLEAHPLPSIRCIAWVEYERLHQLIAEADICLGIFGESGKAGRVIPNKVFQVLQSEKPLITRDSQAIRELLDSDVPGVYLVESGSAKALAEVIREIAKAPEQLPAAPLYKGIKERIKPGSIGNQLLQAIG